MNTTHTLHHRLSDLPLWRLLVALDDAERTAGPDSSTARALARVIQDRLRKAQSATTETGKGPGREVTCE